MHKRGFTLIPCHSQFSMGAISSIDTTSQQTQVQGTFPDIVVQKESPRYRHGGGSNPALNSDGFGGSSQGKAGCRRCISDRRLDGFKIVGSSMFSFGGCCS